MIEQPKKSKKANIVNKGDRFGKLTIITDPFIRNGRQHVHCKCDCGRIRENIDPRFLKRKKHKILYYCKFDCPLREDRHYQIKMEKFQIGDKISHFTVLSKPYHSKKSGDLGRRKYVDVQCACGKVVSKLEHHLSSKKARSCGCKRGKNKTVIETGKLRQCPKCKQTVDSSLFGKTCSICKKCRKATYLSKVYKLSMENYQTLLDKQNAECAICGRCDEMLHIDHCHNSNTIRGLLCSNCNLGLGNFRDNTKFLENAIKYLLNPPNS